MEAGRNRLSLKDANTICQVLNITPAYFFETYENRPVFTDKEARLTKLFSTLDNQIQGVVLSMISAISCEYRG
jgi:transcriptional regulator with XRE-family HTH domain